MKLRKTPLFSAILAGSSLALLVHQSAEAQSYTWANSNVIGSPVPSLNWFSSPQGSWIGGTPASGNTNTIQFFEDNITALANTGIGGDVQTSVIDNGGNPFELGVLTLSGKASATAGANLVFDISGDPLDFSAATGTVNLNALNATQTVAYNVNTAVRLGTIGTGTVLTFTGSGTGTFKIAGNITEQNVGGGSIVKSGTSALTLSGNNSFTGTFSHSGGVLNINSNTALGGSTLAMSTNGTTFDNTSGGLITISNNISSTGNAIFAGSNSLTTLGTVGFTTTNRSLTVNGSGILTVAAAGGTQILRKAGSGTLVITGASTAPGIDFGANSGVLIIGNKASLGTGNFSVVNTGSGTIQASSDLTGANKIANGVTLTGAAALTLSGSNNIELGGVISSTTNGGALLKSGSSTLTLSGANTYQGNTTFSQGILKAGISAAVPSGSGKGNLIFDTAANNAVFDLNGFDVTLNGLSQPSASTTNLVVNSGAGAKTLTLGAGNASSTFAGIIADNSGAGGILALVKTGAGTVTLASANTYTGGTTINAGTLLLSGLSGPAASGSLQVNTGGNFSLADGTARTTTVSQLGLANNSALTFDWNAGAVDTLASTVPAPTVSGGVVSIQISGSNTPTGTGLALLTAPSGLQAGGARYVLANNTDYTATISESDTSITIGGFSAVTAPTLFFWQGNKAAATNAAGFDNALALSGGSASNWSTTVGSYTATGVVPGSTADVIFSTTAAPSQQATVLGVNLTVKSVTFNDATAVSIGGGNTLTLTSGVATVGTGVAGGGSAITVTSAAANPAISASIALGANQTWNVATGRTLTVSGGISGSFALAKADAGTLVLSGVNTFSGGLNVAAGILNINSNTALGAGGISINSTAAFDNTSGGPVTVPNTITSGVNTTFAGTNPLTTTGAYSYNNSNRTLTVNGTGPLTVGALNGGSTGRLRKTGPGTFAITGASTGFGLEFGAAGGVILIGNKTSLGTSSFDVISGGSGILQSSVDLTGANKIGNAVNLIGTGALTLGGSNNYELGGVIASTTSTSTLTKTGNATVTLSGTNTYTGITTLNAGTLSIATIANGASPSGIGQSSSAATNIVFDGGTLQYTGPSAISDRSFSINAAKIATIEIVNGLTIGGATGVATTGSLNKTGNGSLTLSGVNTYTGTTTVTAGALALGTAGTIASSSSLTLSAGTIFDTAAQAAYSLSGSQPVTFKVDGTGSGSSGRISAAGLDITNAAVVFSVVTPLDDAAYVLASYTSKSGAAFASVSPPVGYSIDYAYNGGTQIALVKAGYANWLALYPGLSNTAADGDPDNDGLKNVLEYILNGNPGVSDLSILPALTVTPTNFVFTFKRLDDSETDTTQTFQYGTTLEAWTDVTIGSVSSGPDVNGVTVGVVENGNSPDNITVTVPKGPNTKLFGRLQAVKIP